MCDAQNEICVMVADGYLWPPNTCLTPWMSDLRRRHPYHVCRGARKTYLHYVLISDLNHHRPSLSLWCSHANAIIHILYLSIYILHV
jgi:hypothetical protein